MQQQQHVLQREVQGEEVRVSNALFGAVRHNSIAVSCLCACTFLWIGQLCSDVVPLDCQDSPHAGHLPTLLIARACALIARCTGKRPFVHNLFPFLSLCCCRRPSVSICSRIYTTPVARPKYLPPSSPNLIRPNCPAVPAPVTGAARESCPAFSSCMVPLFALPSGTLPK